MKHLYLKYYNLIIIFKNNKIILKIFICILYIYIKLYNRKLYIIYLLLYYIFYYFFLIVFKFIFEK